MHLFKAGGRGRGRGGGGGREVCDMHRRTWEDGDEEEDV